MFLKRGGQYRIKASPKFGPLGWGGAFVGAPQYCCIRLTIKDKTFERNFRQKVTEKAL